ncbi:MAG: IPT/TIG domain-containing protein, partial [Acidobacteria bacterium]|nr:IPT/TIG domain-containing protein [Acidobacteriota bacterium]
MVLREVGDPENEAVLQDGFLYEAPLAIGRVQPDRGAIAGNTLVTVRGAGFGDATVVFFGADRAKDLKVIDAHTLTCRTPKGTVGTVDVRVQRLMQMDTLAGGFSYFDPRSISGGLSGGPLVGTLNVTVLDSTQGNYGAPISGVTVMLGLEPSTPFQGETDARGQVTFSDPSLVKAQVVTAFKEGFELVTVTEVNAENLTVFMARTGGGEPSSGQPPPPPPPSQISGRVTGFKSPRPLMSGETLEARVFVAQTSLFASAPFRGAPTRRGETWRLQQDGQSYLVLTGAGLRAVYAVLGILGDNDDFLPIAMGVKRGISASPESPALNQDIVLDMQLDLTVPITIDGALTFPSSNPLGGGRTPGLNRVYAWLDLGAEGFIPNALNWAAGTSGESAVSGTGTSLSFPFFPQLDGSNFIFMSETEGPQVYPVSYYFRRQPGPMAPGVTIGPLLPGPQLREPLGVFNGRISWTLEGSA